MGFQNSRSDGKEEQMETVKEKEEIGKEKRERDEVSPFILSERMKEKRIMVMRKCCTSEERMRHTICSTHHSLN